MLIYPSEKYYYISIELMLKFSIKWNAEKYDLIHVEWLKFIHWRNIITFPLSQCWNPPLNYIYGEMGPNRHWLDVNFSTADILLESY